MTDPRLTEALVKVETDLRELGVPWALVGGLAVSAWTEPRTTRDVDVALAVEEDPEAEDLVREMTARGYKLLESLEHKDAHRLSTVRLGMAGKHEGVIADLLFASSGIERELVEAAVPFKVLPDFSVPLARIGHLLALKVLALRPDRPQERPQDLADIRELLKVADDQELRRAREALELISRRPYDRGKDLLAEFESQLQQFRDSQAERGSGY